MIPALHWPMESISIVFLPGSVLQAIKPSLAAHSSLSKTNNFFRRNIYMQRKIYGMVTGITLGLFTLGSSYAQTTTTAVPFQLISPDARASGMGDVGAGIAD